MLHVPFAPCKIALKARPLYTKRTKAGDMMDVRAALLLFAHVMSFNNACQPSLCGWLLEHTEAPASSRKIALKLPLQPPDRLPNFISTQRIADTYADFAATKKGEEQANL